jgi:hypothetical protein
MDENEATSVYDELIAIMRCGPGLRPDSFRRSSVILLRWERHSDANIREKAFQASLGFTTWFSARMWKGKDDGQQAALNLTRSIRQLRDVIASSEMNRPT